MKSDQDTPRAAFNLLSWRVNVMIGVALIALSLIAWRSTIDQAISMRGMVMGLGQIGVLAQGEMGATVFLAMWITMMAAMMLPTIVPMVLAHHAVARQRGERPSGVIFLGFNRDSKDDSNEKCWHPDYAGHRFQRLVREEADEQKRGQAFLRPTAKESEHTKASALK